MVICNNAAAVVVAAAVAAVSNENRVSVGVYWAIAVTN
jgi:hypothetical protein